MNGCVQLPRLFSAARERCVLLGKLAGGEAVK